MRNIILIGCLAVIGLGCEKSKNLAECKDTDLDCSGVFCLITSNLMDFRIVDKSTGADLIFGNSPEYTSGDIALFADAAHTQPIGIVTDNAAKLLKVSDAKQDMYLVIDGQPDIKLTASFRKLDCCSNRVKDLTVNGTRVCACCGDAVAIPE